MIGDTLTIDNDTTVAVLVLAMVSMQNTKVDLRVKALACNGGAVRRSEEHNNCSNLGRLAIAILVAVFFYAKRIL
jgi:hypothetical protein